MPPCLLQPVANAIAEDNNYSSCEFKGSGAFKETFCVTQKTGSIAALKIIERSKIDHQRTLREIEALRACNSPHIASIHNFFVYTHAGVEYDVIIEEFLGGGTLESRIKEFITLQNFKLLAEGLVLAICELKKCGRVHRDIKPANIMFRKDSYYPVLVDFGLVRDLNQSSLTQSWIMQGPGTPLYAAPEQLHNQRDLIDWRTDQFSIAVVLSYCFFSRHPYESAGMTISEIVSAVASRKVSPTFISEAIQEKLSFLIKMAKPWPIQRFNDAEMLLTEIRNI